MYPHLTGENYDTVLKAIKSSFLANYTETVSVVSLVDHVAKRFITETRQKLWEAHRALILSMIHEMMPAAAREFENYYTTMLQNYVSDGFHSMYAESWPREDFAHRLEKLINDVVPRVIAKLTTETGELRDEELVSLYRAGFPKGKTMLLDRYATKLHQLVPRIVHAKNICPESEDPAEFAKDVAQQVLLKLLLQVDSYRLESSFETWVGTICENEANTKQRAILGRSKQGKRKYISFDELKEKSASPPVLVDLSRREILHKVLHKHRLQGPRALKSARAIELRHFDGMETTAVAEALRTSRAYVDQLFSHDYPQLRKICLEDFGLSGTDL